MARKVNFFLLPPRYFKPLCVRCASAQRSPSSLKAEYQTQDGTGKDFKQFSLNYNDNIGQKWRISLPLICVCCSCSLRNVVLYLVILFKETITGIFTLFILWFCKKKTKTNKNENISAVGDNWQTLQWSSQVNIVRFSKIKHFHTWPDELDKQVPEQLKPEHMMSLFNTSLKLVLFYLQEIFLSCLHTRPPEEKFAHN